MSKSHDRYAGKLRTAEEAARLIEPGSKVCLAIGVSQPPALIQALATREDVENIDLYYLVSTANAGSILKTELRGRIRPISLFSGAIERKLDAEAIALGLPRIDFIPCSFSQASKILCPIIDTFLVMVTPPDERGYFNLGVNGSYSVELARSARQVIVEVNPSMPRVYGNDQIHINDVAAVIEHQSALPEFPSGDLRPEDKAIAGHIGSVIDDGACLQLGIGGIPDAVCSVLSNHRHLSAHTELMTPGMAKLMQSGIVDNSRKTTDPGKTVFTLTLGNKALYDFLHDNPDVLARQVEYTNNPAVICQNDNVVSVNSTLEIDLEGNCNSEFANGNQFSGTGGQLDFVRGAGASLNGKSIIACHSTASKGTISKIVPRLSGPVTTPRTDVQYVTTEYGIVNLRGLTLAERAKALIGLAHPDFRETLDREYHARFGI